MDCIFSFWPTLVYVPLRYATYDHPTLPFPSTLSVVQFLKGNIWYKAIYFGITYLLTYLLHGAESFLRS